MKKRGFILLSPERRKEIAASGGRRSWKLGVAHKWTKEETIKMSKLGVAARKKT